MKKIFLKFVITLSASMFCFMIVNVATMVAVQSETASMEYESDFCFNGSVSKKSETILKSYHKAMNSFFNSHIKKTMEAIDFEPEPSPTLDQFEDSPYASLCKTNPLTGELDFNCQMIALCKDNSGTYCMAINTMGIIPEKYHLYDKNILKKDFDYLRNSYLCLQSVLEIKKNDISDLSREKKDVFVTSGRAANKISGINDEIMRARTALNSTLDSYNELVAAWKMHIQYIDIYQSLVSYRDRLVEIRKQTDRFPARFIDASTTSCQ